MRPIVRHVFLVMSDLLPVAQNLTDALFRLTAWEHEFVPAAGTAQTEVHAAAQDKPLLRAAGMLFFHHQNIRLLF